MDQQKIGSFLAELRHKEGWTQEFLGEKIGVTNKTISRWENGNYMPDIEMLQIISAVFNVSINELLAGQILTTDEFRKQADENLITVSKESAFSKEERKQYWIKKWRKEHGWLLVLLLVICVGLVVAPILLNKPLYIGLVPVVMVVLYGYQNNRMMVYVEDKMYGKPK